jgi:hypothetical protein
MKTCQVLQYQIKQIFHFDIATLIVDFVLGGSWQKPESPRMGLQLELQLHWQ